MKKSFNLIPLALIVLFITGCAGAYAPPEIEEMVRSSYQEARRALERAAEKEAPDLAPEKYEEAEAKFNAAREELEELPTEETAKNFKTARQLADEATIAALIAQLKEREEEEPSSPEEPEPVAVAPDWGWSKFSAADTYPGEKDISDTTFYRLEEHLQFDTGTVEVIDDQRPVLEEIADRVRPLEDHYLLAVGSTDDLPVRPGDEFKSNRELALTRASNVVTVLLWSYDLAPEEVGILGLAEHGEFRPEFAALTRAEKRRVEFWLVPYKFLEEMPGI